jgi:hypothetical protein
VPQKRKQQPALVADPANPLLGGLKDLGDRVAAKVGRLEVLEVGSEDAARLVR